MTERALKLLEWIENHDATWCLGCAAFVALVTFWGL